MSILRRDFPFGGIPASAGQPEIPARTVSETETVCGMFPPSSGDAERAAGAKYVKYVANQFYVDAYGFPPIYEYGWEFPPGITRVVYPAYTYSCRPQTTRVYHPAQTYIPPTAAVPGDPPDGWIATAISTGFLKGVGEFSFRVPEDVVGVMVGFTYSSEPSAEVQVSGFYFTKGQAFVGQGFIAQGYASDAYTQNFMYGYKSTDVFRIARSPETDHVLTLYVNDLVLDRVLVPDTGHYLAAMLFASGDSVVDAHLTLFGSGAAAMPALSSSAFSGTRAGGVGTGRMAALDGRGRMGEMGGGSLAPLVSIGGTAYASAQNVLAPLYGMGKSWPPGYTPAAPRYALAYGSLGPMISGGVGSVEGNGKGDASMLAMTSFSSDHPYNTAVTSMAALFGTSFPLEATDEATVFSAGYVGEKSEQLLEVSVSALSSVVGASSLTPSLILEAILQSVARVSALHLDDREDAQTWVMNADTDGTTRYENYGYNSFAKIGGRYYGAKLDGVYLLEGTTDAGEPVNATVNLGNSDFGTSLKKSLTSCYVGVASNNKIVVKVIADGVTYFYSARTSDENLTVQRVDMGRGLRSNFYDLELQNTDGGAFELATVEFSPVPLNRRIQ